MEMKEALEKILEAKDKAYADVESSRVKMHESKGEESGEHFDAYMKALDIWIAFLTVEEFME